MKTALLFFVALLVAAVVSAAPITTSQSVLAAAMGSLVETGEHVQTTAANAPCEDCRKFVTSLASVGLRLGMNHKDLVLEAQTLAQQLGIQTSLKLSASVYMDTENWLRRAGINSATLKDVIAHPQQHCHMVNVCKPVKLSSAITYPGTDSMQTSAAPVILRLKLQPSLIATPKDGDRWKVFVKSFLADMATYLKVDASRFSLRQHGKDVITEIVISAGSKPKEPKPEMLARRLKVAVQQGAAEDLRVPKTLMSALDRSFRPQIIPLAVPSTLVKTTAHGKLAVNTTAVDCPALKSKYHEACGNSYRCTAACKEIAALYHGRCSSKFTSASVYENSYKSFVTFFDQCTQCHIDKANAVKDACKIGIPQASTNYPGACSLHCSRKFVPFFKGCLSKQADNWSNAQRATLNNFYQSCTQCTDVRADAIKKICDPRLGAQRFFYPSTCTTNCSTVYNQYFNACLAPDARAKPVGADVFAQKCQVAADGGGMYVRLTLQVDITTIVHQSGFKATLVKELATVLHTHPSLIAVTGLIASGGNKTTINVGNNQTVTQRVPPKVMADLVFRVSSNVLDLDPASQVDKLRRIIAHPSHPLYSMTLGQTIIAANGVVNLVAHSHTPAKQGGPSSLDLARSELQKAQEHSARADRIEMLRALVAYHLDSSRGANATSLAVAKAKVVYLEAAVHHAAAAKVAALKALYMHALALQKGESAASVSALKANAVYMTSLSKGEGANVIARDLAIYKWRLAAAKPEAATHIALLKAVADKAAAVAAGKPQAAIDYQTALVKLRTSEDAKASQEQIAFDTAVADLYHKKRDSAAAETINHAEARVEYTLAVLKKRSTDFVAYKAAVLAYMKAVDEKKPSAVTKPLSEALIAKYNVVRYGKPQHPAHPSINTAATYNTTVIKVF